ncbi:hypothetical protein [Acinetobacter rongchengensis]|uniref:O-antigen ligase domain-containing protein n=1 Tax=Acinetobacter rongchengensis TaxID=2419601 RepID=A0A3A8F191_9GAMM|nr:hypothetical protein [Acinetobacter rongchengensis]RKG36790.1 hypothetical protein D7V20_13405 [Acinetobacter rongchengensis]
MIAIQRNPGVIFLLFLFAFFSLDVQAPISFYGTQFLGLFSLVVIRFLVYPKISSNSLKLFFCVVVLLEILCFLQNLYIKQEILILVYQRVIFLLSVGILLYDYLILTKDEVLKKALSIFIILMSVIVMLQFIGFYFLNLDRSLLDFGLLLGGEESRTWYSGNWLYRPTGVTSEPAIFVGVQFGLLTIQYLIDKDAKLSKLLGVLSLVLSMSFLGLILAGLFLIIVYSKNITNYIVGSFALFAFYIFSFEMINERIDKFTKGEDGSNNVKIEAFNYFISDPSITLFGYGFLFRSEGKPQFYDALLDLTFYLNSLTIFGVLIGSIILFYFFSFLFKSRTTIKEKMLILLALIKLSNPSVLFFTLFISLCFIILKRRNL